jgi:hypothetical protein
MDRLRHAIARSLETFPSVRLQDDVLISIQEWPVESRDAPAEREWSIDDFEPRFYEILQFGARGWINLNLAEVSPEQARFIVEYFEEPRDGRRYSPGQIVVNISGPLHNPK